MKNIYIFLLFFAGRVAMIAQPALPAPPASIANNLAGIVTNFRITQTIAPGAIVRVYNPDNWEWSFADGIRNVSLGTPATPGLVFRAASISKMFCATAVLKLASQGVLNLDDPIGVWLPAAYVAQLENNPQITIRRLLQHTSSLDEPQLGTSLAGDFLGNPDKNYRDTILQVIANQSGLSAGVGSFSYSNANFNLLAEIVKNASGVRYQDYIIQNIIQPLNLNETYLDTLPVATGFNGYVPCIILPNCPLPDPSTLLDYSQANVGWGYGAADISSTTKDLIHFYYALQNGQIIPQNWVDTLTANAVDAANSFQNKRYGYGTMLFQKNGVTYAIGHTGTAASHANVLCQLKPSNIYVCFSFNIIRFNREALLDQIDAFLQSVTAIAAPEWVQSFSIFPTPASQYCTVNLPGDQDYHLHLSDSYGRVVLEQSIQGPSANIQVSHLANGMYFMQITDTQGRVATKKMMVCR